MKRFNPAANGDASDVAVPQEGAVIFHPPPEPTPDQITAAEQSRREREELSRQRDTFFIEAYGKPGAPLVLVEHGMMAVTLSAKFDNSDSMTDYFDRHANLGPDFILLLVKKQAEAERLTRKALALVPELASLEWEWHTEKWSMGHGNYLESSGFELPDALKNLATRYRGPGITHAHWEIDFSRPYQDGQVVQIYPHRNYGAQHALPPRAAGGASLPAGACPITLTENRERHGIELRFPDKPPLEIREELKAAGFRWSRFSKCWYAKDTPEKHEWAADFIARHNGTSTLEGGASVPASREPAIEPDIHLVPPLVAPVIRSQYSGWAFARPVEPHDEPHDDKIIQLPPVAPVEPAAVPILHVVSSVPAWRQQF